MFYEQKFSILDHEKINSSILNYYILLRKEDFVIHMSPDTLRDPEMDLVFESENHQCQGIQGVYHGIEVLNDPTMKYGEIKLRAIIP